MSQNNTKQYNYKYEDTIANNNNNNVSNTLENIFSLHINMHSQTFDCCKCPESYPISLYWNHTGKNVWIHSTDRTQIDIWQTRTKIVC